ncbi:haloacid dehalogenase-like hydrolase [Roseomonas sp. ACRSG]|nr:haloacid dehalogenase-like hydrolase [Roseomonas sp. ACRSG]
MPPRPTGLSRRTLGTLGLLAFVAPRPAGAQPASEALPSWKPSAARQAIIDFVEAVTREWGPDFVPPPARIAVFDNDGTLWCEIPTVQFEFALDRIRQMAPHHPEWSTTEPFRTALKRDEAELAALGSRGIMELMLATHAGSTPEAFEEEVNAWLSTARHPKFHRPYLTTIYQPMLELLALLERNGFANYIVSGGGIEFVRAWSERAYGIPPQRVIGSSIRNVFRFPQGGQPELHRLAEMDFIDDGPGKPVAIGKFIGRRPIAAFGNSDGDLEMLQYVTAPPGRRLGLVVHHDDAAREVAYDRQSPIGRLDRALDQAPVRGWSVVSMRQDWSTVFPPL